MSEVLEKEVEVIVVGAGPVGLTMASELLRYGIPCRIIDKNASTAHESRALGLQARTLEVFADMGVIDEVLTKSKAVHGVNAYANQGRIAHIDFKLDDLDTCYPFLRVLPQNDTEQILNKHLSKQGLQVERQTAITALSQDEDGVNVTLVDSQGQTQTVRSRWLVGCDGARSTVRHLLNLPFQGSDYEQQFLLADVQIDWNFSDDELHIFLTPDGTIPTFPHPTSGRWRVIYTNGEGQSDEPSHVIQLFQKLLNAHGAPEAIVSNPTWISTFRFHRRMVSQFRVGRCFVAGDAAHIHSPANGQGLNTGIQDAYNLAWKLSLVITLAAPESLLDSYQAERLPVAAAVLSGGSDLTTKAVTLHNSISQQIRNQLLSFLSGFDFIQRRISRGISQLELNYRKSMIVAEDRLPIPQIHILPQPSFEPSPLDYLDFSAAPRPGDRAPDVVFSSAESKHLFDVLKGTKHTLLLFAGVNPTSDVYCTLETVRIVIQNRYGKLMTIYLIVTKDTAIARLSWNGSLLSDQEGTLHNRYGAGSECLYLIRPDGYIGYRSQPVDSDKLLAYLQQLFL